MMSTANPSATSPAHLMNLFAARAGAGEIDALMELYEPDATFQPAFGTTLVGYEQVRAGISEFIQLDPQITYLSEPDVIIVGDIALVTNFWTMAGTAPDGSAIGESGASADVCRRRSDGTWGVLIDQPRGEPTS